MFVTVTGKFRLGVKNGIRISHLLIIMPQSFTVSEKKNGKKLLSSFKGNCFRIILKLTPAMYSILFDFYAKLKKKLAAKS